MVLLLLECLKHLLAGPGVIDARWDTKCRRYLLDCLVALLRVEKDKVLNHQNANNVLDVVFVNGNPAKALSVNVC